MKIIIKADDLAGYPGKNSIIPKRWQKFVDIIKKYNIKANIGIIGNSLLFDDYGYFEWIRDNEKYIEYFNHGFLHRKFNFDGIEYEEFRGTSIQYQLNLINYTNQLAKEKVGIELISFGAPYNATDKNTSLALNQTNIKTAYFLTEEFNGVNLKDRIDIEVPVHCPNFNEFKNNFTKKKYAVIQVHPNSWDEYYFNEFEKMIKFLKDYEFIFAKEMA